MAALLSKVRNPLAFNVTHRILLLGHSQCRKVIADNRLLLAKCPETVQLHSLTCLNHSRTNQCGSKSTPDHLESLNRNSNQCTLPFNLRHLRYRAAPSNALHIQKAESAAPSRSISFQSSIFRRTLTGPSPKEERSLNIYTIPNAICVFRIAASPFIGYLVVDGRYEFALYSFVLAGISDGLDGFIARNFNQRSVLGSYLDPISDKILINILATACAVTSLLPSWLVLLVLIRDALLIGGSVILARKVSRERGRDLFKQAASLKLDSPLEIKASVISKVNTVLQLTSISVALASAAYGHLDFLHLVMPWIHYATGATTVATLLDYMRRPGIAPAPPSS